MAYIKDIDIMVGHFDWKHSCLVAVILPSRWQDGAESPRDRDLKLSVVILRLKIIAPKVIKCILPHSTFS